LSFFTDFGCEFGSLFTGKNCAAEKRKRIQKEKKKILEKIKKATHLVTDLSDHDPVFATIVINPKIFIRSKPLGLVRKKRDIFGN